MTPLWGHSVIVADFVAGMVPPFNDRGFGPCEAMGVIDSEGRLVGGLVFHNYSPEFGTIEVSGASVDRRWLPRSIMHEIAAYVFGRLGCQMLYTRNDPEARHIRRLWRAVGGVEHEIPRMRGRDSSEILIVVTEEAWNASKFMEGSNATRKRTAERAEPDADGHGRGAAGAGRAGTEAEPVSAYAPAAAGATAAGAAAGHGVAGRPAAHGPAPDR